MPHSPNMSEAYTDPSAASPTGVPAGLRWWPDRIESPLFRARASGFSAYADRPPLLGCHTMPRGLYRRHGQLSPDPPMTKIGAFGGRDI